MNTKEELMRKGEKDQIGKLVFMFEVLNVRK